MDGFRRPDAARLQGPLRSPHVSLGLALALAITEWWLDQEPTDFKTKRVELAGLLEDVGFQQTAVQDLTGMISGEAVSDKELALFDEQLGRLQRKKMLQSHSGRKGVAVALSDCEHVATKTGSAGALEGPEDGALDLERAAEVGSRPALRARL